MPAYLILNRMAYFTCNSPLKSFQLCALLFIIIGLASFQSDVPKGSNSLEELNLKGNIQSVEYEYFRIEDNFGESKLLKTEKVLERISCTESEFDYQRFDASGNIVEGKSYSWPFSSTSFVYDHGLLLNSIEFMTPNRQTVKAYKSYYKYDEQKRMIQESTYKFEDGLEILNEFMSIVYSENGRKKSFSFKNKFSELTGRMVEIYDDKGRIVSKIWYSKEGELESKYLTSYSDDGRTSTTRKYNEFGVEVLTETKVFNENLDMILHKYFTHSDKTTNLWEYKYLYRKHGQNENWHLKTTFRNSIELCAVRQAIEYY